MFFNKSMSFLSPAKFQEYAIYSVVLQITTLWNIYTNNRNTLIIYNCQGIIYRPSESKKNTL